MTPKPDNLRELTYWIVWGDFKKISELTYVARDILAMVANCDNKGLKLLNHEIANQLLISTRTVKTCLQILKEQDYIKITKAKSSYRKILCTKKTKAIVQKAKRQIKGKKQHDSTGENTYPVKDSTGEDIYPVTGENGSPLLGKVLTQSNINKEKNKNNSSANALEINNISASLHRETNTGFDLFWTAYPRREAKKDAQKAWGKLKPGPELIETILQAIERQKQAAQWQRDGGKYIPYPATWINGERWTDEVGGNGEMVCRDATDEDVAMLEREGIL